MSKVWVISPDVTGVRKDWMICMESEEFGIHTVRDAIEHLMMTETMSFAEWKTLHYWELDTDDTELARVQLTFASV